MGKGQGDSKNKQGQKKAHIYWISNFQVSNLQLLLPAKPNISTFSFDIWRLSKSCLRAIVPADTWLQSLPTSSGLVAKAMPWKQHCGDGRGNMHPYRRPPSISWFKEALTKSPALHLFCIVRLLQIRVYVQICLREVLVISRFVLDLPLKVLVRIELRIPVNGCYLFYKVNMNQLTLSIKSVVLYRGMIRRTLKVYT